MEDLTNLTSDVEIAKSLGVKVPSTKQLIRKHTQQLLIFGNLYFKRERSSSGQTIKTYFLNELQQHFIFSIARPINRNGEEVAKINKVVEIGQDYRTIQRAISKGA
ncbi:hypothetical protein ABU186_08760 [Weissella paramesenteroides]